MAFAMAALKERIKGRAGPLWWYSALQFASGKAADVVNLYVGAFLIPAVLSADDLGAIVPLRMIIAYAVFPMGLLAGVAVKFLNAFHVGDDRGRVKAVLRDMAVAALAFSVAALLILWIGADFVRLRLKLENSAVLLWLAATVVISCWTPIPDAAAQGLMRFRQMIVAGLIRPGAYLLLAVLLLPRFGVAGFLAATAGTACVGAAYLAWMNREYLGPGIAPGSYREVGSEIWRYVRNAGAVLLCVALVNVVEPWTIRNFTSKMDSAGYYMAFMFGQIPLYLSSAFMPFLFPLVSARHESGKSTEALLRQSVAATLAVGIPFVILAVFCGKGLMDLRGSWRTYDAYAPFIWRIGVVSTLQGIVLAYLSHENGCRRFGYVKLFLPALLAEAVVLYVLMGWGFFETRLPRGVWEAVERLVGSRLDFAVWVMMAARALMAVPAVVALARGAPPPADRALNVAR
jgi:MFS family permease